MGAFELSCSNETEAEGLDQRRLREECIIAFKVYDSCRQQDCLDGDTLGPARAAEDKTINGQHIQEGEIIVPPQNAASVCIENLRVCKVIVVDKAPSAFKRGFWDITLKYVFKYKLVFREADGTVINCIRANSIFTKKVTLFGSEGSDITLSTDLLSRDGMALDADPFILVEAKA